MNAELILQSISDNISDFYDFLRGIVVPYFHINLLAFVAIVVGLGAVLYLVFGELFNPPTIAGGD